MNVKQNEDPKQSFPILVKTEIAMGGSPFAGARGALAPSSSPCRRRRQKGTLESPKARWNATNLVAFHRILESIALKSP